MTDFLKHWTNQNEENAKLMAQELLITEVTEEIWKAMEETGVNKTELANRIGVTKGYISQVLGGSRNMTLRTLSDICFALGKQVTITMEAKAAYEEERNDDDGRLARVSAKQTSQENEATSE